MNIKNAYLAKLCQVFDDESLMTALMERKIPTIPDITVGSSNEEVNLAASQFFANQNVFLQQFEGVPILQFLLMGCALSPVFQSMSLSGLELAKSPSPCEYRIISPVDGVTYEEALIWLKIEIISGLEYFTGASVRINGNPPTALDPIDFTSIFGIEEEFPSGVHTVEFTAVFYPNYWSVQSASFTVDLPIPPDPDPEG